MVVVALISVFAVGAAIVVMANEADDTDAAVIVESRTTTPTGAVPTAPGAPPGPDDPTVTAPNTPPPAPRPPPTTVPPVDGAVVAGAPEGITGDRLTPVPAGQIADVGDGWRIQIVDVIDDATERVVADSFLDRPPPGSRYTQVAIRAGYYGLADPTSTFEIELFAVGRDGFELDDSCSYHADGFAPFVDVFTGGVAAGNLCFLTTASDNGELLLRARLLGENGVYLDASAPSTPVAEMPTLRGPQVGAAATPARLDPVPIGVPAEIGDGWTMTVLEPARDVTDAPEAGDALDVPPPGERLMVFDVEVRYEGAGTGSGYDTLIGVIDDSNVAGDAYCGYLEDEIDLYEDVAAGEVLSGTLCALIAQDDVASMMAYATGGYDVGPTFFSLIDDPAATPQGAPSPVIFAG